SQCETAIRKHVIVEPQAQSHADVIGQIGLPFQRRASGLRVAWSQSRAGKRGVHVSNDGRGLLNDRRPVYQHRNTTPRCKRSYGLHMEARQKVDRAVGDSLVLEGPAHLLAEMRTGKLVELDHWILSLISRRRRMAAEYIAAARV